MCGTKNETKRREIFFMKEKEQGAPASGGKLKKNIATLLILTISGAMVYSLPYFRNYYYDAFLESFNITNTQMGLLGSVFGGFSIIAFFLGGFCADRWPAKKLLPLSLFATGGMGLLLLLKPPFWAIFLIHALWGITAILTFWSALIKALRSIADEDEQGKVFGFFEGGRGITNMVQSALVLGMFGFLSSKINTNFALMTVIVVYSAINIILGILVIIFYKEEKFERQTGALINVPAMKRLLKMPTTWLHVIIIFCSYAICCSYFYITPYATAVFGATAVVGAAMGYFSQYCRPIGCFVAGMAADKIGSSKVCAISYAILVVGLIGVIFTPGKPSMIFMLLVFCAAVYASMYGCQSMHFAIMEEGDYPMEITGTANSILTPLGYSVELFAPMVAGLCIDHWAGATGYKVFFGILTVLAAIGFIATLLWMAKTKDRRMEIEATKKAKAAAKAKK